MVTVYDCERFSEDYYSSQSYFSRCQSPEAAVAQEVIVCHKRMTVGWVEVGRWATLCPAVAQNLFVAYNAHTVLVLSSTACKITTAGDLPQCIIRDWGREERRWIIKVLRFFSVVPI